MADPNDGRPEDDNSSISDIGEEEKEKDDNWDDWEASEEETEPARSLFSDKVLPSPEEAMQYDCEHYLFDIRQYAIQEHLDEYDIFRCINFIRRQKAAGVDPLPLLTKGSSSLSSWRGNDEMLKPFLADDALLFYDYENVVDSWKQNPVREMGAASALGDSDHSTNRELLRLKDENEALREALAMMAASCLPEELREESSKISSDPGPSSAQTTTIHNSKKHMIKMSNSCKAGSVPLSESAKEVDGSYFDSYGGFGIHQEMISDKPRTEAYQKAIEANPSLIKGKAVLDVGCGTGILSLFACRAGAAHVISVEGNKGMAGFARKVSKSNGYNSEDGGPMTVLQGKVEELGNLPVDKVDVLVSEWMGYALLFETMLDSVLIARDRYLKPGGAMLPDIATIHIAGASSGASGSPFWKDVYGFDMSPIAEEVHKAEIGNANVHLVKGCDIVTCDVQIKELDLCTMKADDQDFTAEFSLVAQQPSLNGNSSSINCPAASQVQCHAIVLWFDTDFSSRHCQEAPVKLSTSWSAPPTHWSQTVMLLKEPVWLEVPGQVPGEGEPPSAKSLSGRVSMVRNKHKHRYLDISLEYKAVLSDGKIVSHTSMYSMSVQA